MIYTDDEYDVFKNTICPECQEYNICELFDFDRIDACLEGQEVSEREQADRDKEAEL